MSVEFNSDIMVGWRFTGKQIHDRFATVIPEQSHMEDRFDHKTGHPVEPEEVFDEDASIVLRYKGIREEDEDYEGFMSKLFAHPDLQDLFHHEILWNDAIHEQPVVIGIKIPPIGKRADWGGMTVGPDLTIPPDFFQKIEQGKQILESVFNCRLGSASIINAAWISC